ncbi:hypothetical protein [Reinekea sp.]|jgi:hypothetical protein|uniref:hypothetical protein n=1 Tax=Reinekea sp. TaxID=1970455 RepID=UPI002A7F198B|nr:hypothetical protein [Reinekea sp.]
MQRATPLIIDIEASGFGFDSYPIEVGIALPEGERFCTLIEPIHNWTHWDQSAEGVHHISREELHLHGKSIFQVTRDLNTLLHGQTLYSDGWVVDKPWLNTLFYAAHTSMDFFVSPLEMILSDYQMDHWHLIKDVVMADLKLTRHRASNDAYIIQETYRRSALEALTHATRQ